MGAAWPPPRLGRGRRGDERLPVGGLFRTAPGSPAARRARAGGLLMDTLISAIGLVFEPYTLTVIVLSGVFGLFIGAVPGLTATMATALLVPVTFFMEPVPAIAAIVSSTADRKSTRLNSSH